MTSISIHNITFKGVDFMLGSIITYNLNGTRIGGGEVVFYDHAIQIKSKSHEGFHYVELNKLKYVTSIDVIKR
jgi:hypothetical protein